MPDFQFKASPAPIDGSRIKGVAYSGGLMNHGGQLVVVDLAQTEIDNTPPLLHQHRDGEVIGTIARLQNDGRQLTLEAQLFTDIDPIAKAIAAKAARGLRLQMSIGLYGAQSTVLPAAATINGREAQEGTRVLRGGRVREVSIVSVGADENTTVALFSADHAEHGSPLDPDMVYAQRRPRPTQADRLSVPEMVMLGRVGHA